MKIEGLSKEEKIIIKDALVEYWHNSMKHSKNEKFKEMARCLKEDFKILANQKQTR